MEDTRFLRLSRQPRQRMGVALASYRQRLAWRIDTRIRREGACGNQRKDAMDGRPRHRDRAILGHEPQGESGHARLHTPAACKRRQSNGRTHGVGRIPRHGRLCPPSLRHLHRNGRTACEHLDRRVGRKRLPPCAQHRQIGGAGQLHRRQCEICAPLFLLLSRQRDGVAFPVGRRLAEP